MGGREIRDRAREGTENPLVAVPRVACTGVDEAATGGQAEQSTAPTVINQQRDAMGGETASDEP